uniref:Uncharacterized protein n=1 Tax=Anopheles albimanus TaxID=7167 RepID=A0A182FI01_ANOAL
MAFLLSEARVDRLQYSFPVKSSCFVSPNTRRTKSFDDQTWKVHDETANLSANISAISTTALASRSCRLATDLGPAGLDEVLVMSASSEPSSAGDGCDSLSRGEVRKSRSKMKNYLKRCKDVLIGGDRSLTGTEDVSSAAAAAEPSQHESVVYHAAGSAASSIQPNSSSSCWYLEDHLIELRTEDNREPYSSLASARLKLETEEARLAACSSISSSSGGTIVPSITTSVSSTTAPIEHRAFDPVPQDDRAQSVSERVANGHGAQSQCVVRGGVSSEERERGGSVYTRVCDMDT